MEFRSLLPFGRSSNLSAFDYDPFAYLRREMERSFNDIGRGWNLPAVSGNGFLSPKVNIAETDRGLELTAELPGVDQKDIELNLEDDILTLRAERKLEQEKDDEKKHYHIQESAYGMFMRRFSLPFEAESGGVEATFEKGVLKVFVPRSNRAPKSATRVSIKGR